MIIHIKLRKFYQQCIIIIYRKIYKTDLLTHPESKNKQNFMKYLNELDIFFQSKPYINRYDISTKLSELQNIRLKYYKKENIQLKQLLSNYLIEYSHCDGDNKVKKYLEKVKYYNPIKIEENIELYNSLSYHYINIDV